MEIIDVQWVETNWNQPFNNAGSYRNWENLQQIKERGAYVYIYSQLN